MNWRSGISSQILSNLPTKEQFHAHGSSKLLNNIGEGLKFFLKALLFFKSNLYFYIH